MFLDTGARRYLIDCGAGVDHAGAVAALGHRHIAGLVLTLPSPIDLLQAPNHGSPPGRMARWVLDDHLQPGVVIVTDAEPLANDHLAWYSGRGRQAYTLQDRRTIS